MQTEKIIMLFLDLEGTIIEEETGKLKEDKINQLLYSLKGLQEVSESTVNIHIASPVDPKFMADIMDKIDRLIIRYNIQNQTNLKEVESAVAYPEVNYIQQHDLYDKIFPMDISQKEDASAYGKLKYVRSWVETIEDSNYKDIDFIIYGGNGINDTKAMSYVKETGKGFVICPNNSDESVKKIANYISEKDEAEGIKEGIMFIKKEIEKRKKRKIEVAKPEGTEIEL